MNALDYTFGAKLYVHLIALSTQIVLIHLPLGEQFQMYDSLTSYKIAISLRWMSQNFTNAESTLVQAMAWRRQATSHSLSQYWYRFVSPHGVPRPQWVNEVVKFT